MELGKLQIVLQFLSVPYVFSSSNVSLPSVCKSCPGALNSTTSVIVEKCKDLVIIDRCCINKTSTEIHSSDVIGVDLSGCGIHDLNYTLLPLVNVINVALANNSVTGDLQSQFHGLSQMEYLSLPGEVECPGGNDSWERIAHSDHMTVCQGQIDLCLNFTCPQSSHCIPRGPGLKDCLCDDGHYGYKCLRSGRFHTEAFACGLAGVTVVLSVFLWVTQRRHVKKRL